MKATLTGWLRGSCFAALCLLLAACGGGSNKANEVKAELDSAEGAIAAYQYAIMNLDEAIAEQVFAPENREYLMGNLRENKRKAAVDNVSFKVEVGQAFEVKQGIVVAEVTYTTLDSDGKPKGTPIKRWCAWVKESDGMWRFNFTAAEEYRLLRAQQDAPPANEAPPANGG